MLARPADRMGGSALPTVRVAAWSASAFVAWSGTPASDRVPSDTDTAGRTGGATASAPKLVRSCVVLPVKCTGAAAGATTSGTGLLTVVSGTGSKDCTSALGGAPTSVGTNT